jgi:hypothetical protein
MIQSSSIVAISAFWIHEPHSPSGTNSFYCNFHLHDVVCYFLHTFFNWNIFFKFNFCACLFYIFFQCLILHKLLMFWFLLYFVKFFMMSSCRRHNLKKNSFIPHTMLRSFRHNSRIPCIFYFSSLYIGYNNNY